MYPAGVCAPCQIRKAEKGEGAALEGCPHMVPGKYIDISVVPGKEDVFGIVTDIATKVVPEKSGA